MKISIVGWYGKNNVGDEAFRFVLSDFFQDHQVEFVTPPQLCSNPDIVVLGGGAVASPFYLDTLPNCPRYALGIDLAYESEADLLAKANFREVYVRTKTDAEALSKKLTCPVHAIPDLAFYLQATKQSKRHGVGVLVTDYILPAIDRPYDKFGARAINFVRSFASELDKLTAMGHEIVLIPCSTAGYGNDLRINLDLAAHMKNQPRLIKDALNPIEMIDLLAGLQSTICMRFHAHIFSMIANTPFASIEFTRKVALFLKEHSLEHLNVVPKDPLVAYVLWRNLLPINTDYSHVVTSYRQRLVEVKKQVRSKWLGEDL